MTSRQWTLLEVEIEASQLRAESPDRMWMVRRVGARIKRRWRLRELLELDMLDLGGEA